MIGAFALRASLLLAGAPPVPSQVDIDGLIAELAGRGSDSQDDAACALGRLGREAGRAVPALSAILQREILGVSYRTRSAVAPRLRDKALPNCAAVVDSMREAFSWQPRAMRDAHRRDWYEWQHGPVVWAIRKLDGSEVAGRALLDMFRDEPELRCDHRAVPLVLASLGPGVLPALEEGLRDEVSQVRYFAVRAIPDLRPMPADAERLLQHAIDWDLGDVRSAAVEGMEAVAAHRRHEREDEEREQRAAAAAQRDWLSEFPSYPGASRVCSGHVAGSATGRRRDMSFSVYATKDDPAVVVAFYADARRIKSERGARTLDVASGGGTKHVAVHPVSDEHPGCNVKPPKGTRTVLVVSEATP